MRSTMRCLSLLLAIVVLASSHGAVCAAPEPGDGQVGPSVEAPSQAPVLLSPADGATATGATQPPVGVPTLRWSAVAGATKYHVQVSASAGFADPIVEQDTYATTYTPAVALADGTYYWRVKAGAGTVVEWGPTQGRAGSSRTA